MHSSPPKGPVERLRRALPAAGSLLAILLGLKLTLTGHLMYTVTGSIPRGIYWITPSHQANRGELVTFPIPEGVRELLYERGYLPRTVKILAKPVAAAEGDQVCVRAGELFINGQWAGVVRESDGQGLPLPRLALCRRLTAGELFVATTHANSFDSRHFGLITLRELRGTLTPLLTFQ